MPYHSASVAPPRESYQDISGIFSIVIEAMMVFGNIFPIVVVCKLKRTKDRTVADELIVALSITDILSVVVPTPLGLISYFSQTWYGGQQTCNFYQLTTLWFQVTSMCLVTYMCIDRLLALKKAMVNKSPPPTSSTVKIIVFCIYIFTLGIVCLPLFGLAPKSLSSSGQLCESWIIAEPKEVKQHVFYMIFLGLGYANLTVAICVNFRVIVTLWSYTKRLVNVTMDRRTLGYQVDRKTVLDFTSMILTVTIVFYLTWLPALVSDRIRCIILYYTVSTFNSCTKCVCNPGVIHDRTPGCHPVSWAWMTSQLNVSLIRKLRGSLMCLAYCLTCHPWVFVQPDTGKRPVDSFRKKCLY